MLILITYDVHTSDPAGAKRLRKVAKTCVAKGQRVQNSVFECSVDEAQYRQLKHQLEGIIDPEKDSLRFYRLGNNGNDKIETAGRDGAYKSDGIWII